MCTQGFTNNNDIFLSSSTSSVWSSKNPEGTYHDVVSMYETTKKNRLIWFTPEYEYVKCVWGGREWRRALQINAYWVWMPGNVNTNTDRGKMLSPPRRKYILGVTKVAAFRKCKCGEVRRWMSKKREAKKKMTIK